MNMPCIVELDLHRHLRQMDWQDAQDERAQELIEERRRYLIEDRPGFSLITEALFVEEIGYPLDEALFVRISLMTATDFTGRWPVISAEGGTPVQGWWPGVGAQRRGSDSVTAPRWGWSRGLVVFAGTLR